MKLKELYKEFLKQLSLYFNAPVKKGDLKKGVSNWDIFFALVSALVFTILAYLYMKLKGH